MHLTQYFVDPVLGEASRPDASAGSVGDEWTMCEDWLMWRSLCLADRGQTLAIGLIQDVIIH
jgi:hypothetical protein